MRMLVNKYSIILQVVVSVVALQCRRQTPTITRQNFAPYYAPDKKPLQPSYVVYNVSDSVSRLYFSVQSNDLLYARNEQENNYFARILLNYVVHPLNAKKFVADSGHVVMSDVNDPGVNKILAGAIDFDLTTPGKYFLELTFRDLNKMTISHNILYLDNSSVDAKNNFLITPAGSETPFFRNYLDSGELIAVRHRQPKVQALYFHYYKNEFGPAPPPYAALGPLPFPAPDSVWALHPSQAEAISLDRPGYYIISTSKDSRNGTTLCRFHPDYPKVTEVNQLIYPLRYLTTKQEYQEMLTASNKKKAVDDFWLGKGGSEMRARELIRHFYFRVEAANRLFSSHKEGWKTDRGMIYLIFGPPSSVYRNADSETWFYGTEGAGNSLSFIFRRNSDGITDAEFVLDRSMNYKVAWIQAVDMWRQGQVYTAR